MIFENSKVYDILKYIALVVLPPLEAFIIGIGEVWGIAVMAKVGATVALLATLLGAILLKSAELFSKHLEVVNNNDTDENQILMAESMLEEDEQQMVKGE